MADARKSSGARTPLRRRRSIQLVSALVILIAVIASVSSSGSKVPSGPFTGASAKLVAATTAAVNEASASPGVSGIPSARCPSSGGTLGCHVAYSIKEPAGINYGLETIAPTTGVFKYAFSDKKVAEVSVTVSGPATSEGGKTSTTRLFSLLCFRSDANQIDWDTVTVSGLERICTFSQFVNNP